MASNNDIRCYRKKIVDIILAIKVESGKSLRQVQVPEKKICELVKNIALYAPNILEGEPFRFKILYKLPLSKTIYILLKSDAGKTTLADAGTKITEWKDASKSLLRYALNLLLAPKRPEFQRLKLSSSYYVYQVAKKLKGAEEILLAMGYERVGGTKDAQELRYSGEVNPNRIAETAADLVILDEELDRIRGLIQFALDEKLQTNLSHILEVRDHPTEIFDRAKFRLAPNTQYAQPPARNQLHHHQAIDPNQQAQRQQNLMIPQQQQMPYSSNQMIGEQTHNPQSTSYVRPNEWNRIVQQDFPILRQQPTPHNLYQLSHYNQSQYQTQQGPPFNMNLHHQQPSNVSKPTPKLRQGKIQHARSVELPAQSHGTPGPLQRQQLLSQQPEATPSIKKQESVPAYRNFHILSKPGQGCEQIKPENMQTETDNYDYNYVNQPLANQQNLYPQTTCDADNLQQQTLFSPPDTSNFPEPIVKSESELERLGAITQEADTSSLINARSDPIGYSSSLDSMISLASPLDHSLYNKQAEDAWKIDTPTSVQASLTNQIGCNEVNVGDNTAVDQDSTEERSGDTVPMDNDSNVTPEWLAMYGNSDPDYENLENFQQTPKDFKNYGKAAPDIKEKMATRGFTSQSSLFTNITQSSDIPSAEPSSQNDNSCTPQIHTASANYDDDQLNVKRNQFARKQLLDMKRAQTSPVTVRTDKTQPSSNKSHTSPLSSLDQEQYTSSDSGDFHHGNTQLKKSQPDEGFENISYDSSTNTLSSVPYFPDQVAPSTSQPLGSLPPNPRPRTQALSKDSSHRSPSALHQQSVSTQNSGLSTVPASTSRLELPGAIFSQQQYLGSMRLEGRDRSNTHTNLDTGVRINNDPNMAALPGTWICDYCTNLVDTSNILCDICDNPRVTAV